MSDKPTIVKSKTPDAAGYITSREEVRGIFVLPPLVGNDPDGPLPITVIATVADAAVLRGEAMGVYSFADLRVLECVIDYPDLFIDNLTVLEGFPGTVYTPVFRDLTFSLPTYAYDALMLDLASFKNAEQAQLRDTRHTPESTDKLSTRLSGHKRQFADYTLETPEFAEGGGNDVGAE